MENTQQGSLSIEETIAGVVHPTGVGAGKSRGEADWTLRFSFAAWRSADGQLHRTKLRLHRILKDGELPLYRRRLRPYDVVNVRVRFANEGSAELTEIVSAPLDADAELLGIAEHLRRPLVEKDDFFGDLTFDRTVEWYEGVAKWHGSPVTLYVSPSDDGRPGPAIAVARKLWSDQDSMDRRLRDCAVGRLLDIKNRNWLDEDEDPVSADAFAARMRIKSVTAYADGDFDFSYDDDELFWGHTIAVTGNLSDGPTDASISG